MDYASTIPGATMLYSGMECQSAYVQMAEWIDLHNRPNSNGRPLMLVGPMQGALVVLAQVVRLTKTPVTYRMVDVSLYDEENRAREEAVFGNWQITDKELAEYSFVVVDDVAESLRTYEAMRSRLVYRGAEVSLITLVDKPSEQRVRGLSPDFAPLSVSPNAWIVGEGMNNGDDVPGQRCRGVSGIWAMDI